MGKEGRFGRKLWGLLQLELWQRAFHDDSGCPSASVSRPDRISGNARVMAPARRPSTRRARKRPSMTSTMTNVRQVDPRTDPLWAVLARGVSRSLQTAALPELTQLANALKISVETLYVRAGLLADPSAWVRDAVLDA